jgi:hypothetical protein
MEDSKHLQSTQVGKIMQLKQPNGMTKGCKSQVLSWSVNWRMRKEIFIYGGDRSCFYDLFHSPIERILTSEIHSMEGGYTIRNFRFGKLHTNGMVFVEATLPIWKELFSFFDEQELPLRFFSSSRGILFSVPYNYYGRNSFCNKTVETIESILPKFIDAQ